MTDKESDAYIEKVLKQTGKSSMRVLMHSMLVDDVLRSIDESKDGELRNMQITDNLEKQSHADCKRALSRIADCYRDVIIAAMMGFEELSKGAGAVFLASLTESDELLNKTIEELTHNLPVDMSKN